MRTRMVPFDALVPRLRRVLRQAASDTGKQVAAQARRRAGRTRSQRARAHDRAAGAHAAQRGRARPGIAGRTPQGEASRKKARSASRCAAKVRKSCWKSATTARGLNRDAIRKRGDRARPDPQPTRALADGDLDVLIFEPGFSTADDSQPPGRPRRRHGRGRQRSPPARRHARHPVRSRARARTSSCACRRRSRSRRRCSCKHRRHQLRGADRLGARRGPHRRATSWTSAGAQPTATAARTTRCTTSACCSATRRRRPKASCRCRCCWSAPATCARRSPSTRSSATAKSWSSRSARRSARCPGIFGATIMGDGRVVVILDVAPLVRRQAALPRDVAPAHRWSRRARCRWSWWSTTRSPCARSPAACSSATTSRC